VPAAPADLGLSLEAIDTSLGGGLLDGISVDDSSRSPASIHVQMITIKHDSLIDSYYKNFHRFHPFVLPKRHMTRHYQDPSRQPSWQPLIAAMRLIGHIYARREWSTELKDHIEACCAQASPSDPVIIQARLLYSIALFWYDQKNQAKSESDNAIQLALTLQLSREEFAIQYGGDDPVLAESWRRTWWMLYIVDAYYTGTLGTMEMRAVDVNATVKLPCEEDEYESGVCWHNVFSEIHTNLCR
jgi:hypothetical protein